jgi:adenylosuccinate synthase
MKADVLDSFAEIFVCEAYELDGRRVSEVPSSVDQLARVRPILRSFKGWQAPLSKCPSMAELPPPMKTLLDYVENQVGCRVDLVSTGPDRQATLYRRGSLMEELILAAGR